MRRVTIDNGWMLPHSGSWRLNPWIKSAPFGLQARHPIDGGMPAQLAAGSVADRGPASTKAHHAEDRQQQKAAIRTWEDEGGSIGTHRGLRR